MKIADSLSGGAQRSVGDVAAWTGQRVRVERSAGDLGRSIYDLTDDIQTISGDHKMVAPELDGGVPHRNFVGLRCRARGRRWRGRRGSTDDGEARRSYSMVLGVAPSCSPSSSRAPTRCGRGPSRRLRAPTTKIKQGLGFGIPRAGQGRREREERWLPTELEVVNGGGGLDSRIPTTLARIGQSYATTSATRGGEEVVRALRAAMGAFYRPRSRLGFRAMGGAG